MLLDYIFTELFIDFYCLWDGVLSSTGNDRLPYTDKTTSAKKKKCKNKQNAGFQRYCKLEDK